MDDDFQPSYRQSFSDPEMDQTPLQLSDDLMGEGYVRWNYEYDRNNFAAYSSQAR